MQVTRYYVFLYFIRSTVFKKISYLFKLGSIPNLLTVELFDGASRAKANSIACAANWGSNFLVVVTFPFLNVSISIFDLVISDK